MRACGADLQAVWCVRCEREQRGKTKQVPPPAFCFSVSCPSLSHLRPALCRATASRLLPLHLSRGTIAHYISLTLPPSAPHISSRLNSCFFCFTSPFSMRPAGRHQPSACALLPCSPSTSPASFLVRLLPLPLVSSPLSFSLATSVPSRLPAAYLPLFALFLSPDCVLYCTFAFAYSLVRLPVRMRPALRHSSISPPSTAATADGLGTNMLLRELNERERSSEGRRVLLLIKRRIWQECWWQQQQSQMWGVGRHCVANAGGGCAGSVCRSYTEPRPPQSTA